MPVQVTSRQADGALCAIVSGEFGFEVARELLLVCKTRWQEGASMINVDMSGVTGLSSSGVGTLILLSELAGDDRFKLRMENCAPEVRELFDSGILDKYFKKGVVAND